MDGRTRRGFLADVGRGMFAASLGPALAYDLGLTSAAFATDAGDDPGRLSFGGLEPLVSAIQETPLDRLLPDLVRRLRDGTDLRQLTAAAALANARAFGGENYRGYHAFMAIAPAYHMAVDCPADRRPLPVLKVIHRNASFIQAAGANESDVLHPIEPMELPPGVSAGESLREANLRSDVEAAERAFAAIAQQPDERVLCDLLQFNVEDHASVHEVVLVWRAWALLDFTGREYAHTLLRQSVRQCVDQSGRERQPDPRRLLVARLIDEHHLASPPTAHRPADDAWIDELCGTVYGSDPEHAAEAVAMALAEGFSTEDVGEALALAANQLVLRQVENWGDGGIGRRTHGDSPGVHASDAVNAWRNIARVSDGRSAAASMLLGAYFVADMRRSAAERGTGGHAKEPFPRAEDLERITATEQARLLGELDSAVRENDQLRACAIVHRSGQLGHAERPLFDALLRSTVSEDGRLHGEKYYRTVAEEFAAARPAFRWRHLAALARVTSSAYGYGLEDERIGRAPGYEEACGLLRVEA